MAKKIWISALDRDEKSVRAVMAAARQYALEPEGHFWPDDKGKMSWSGAARALQRNDIALWAIIAKAGDVARGETRFGLSMAALTAQAGRNERLPVMILAADNGIAAESFPPLLRNAQIVPLAGPGIGAKLVVRANERREMRAADYRLNVHGLPGIGLWFEVGPTATPWRGVMAGVSGTSIDAHAVGPAGHVPERTLLEYPIKGMKIQSSAVQFDAWAVRNTMDRSQSYYFRCQGAPGSLLFGEFSADDEAEAYVLNVC